MAISRLFLLCFISAAITLLSSICFAADRSVSYELTFTYKTLSPLGVALQELWLLATLNANSMFGVYGLHFFTTLFSSTVPRPLLSPTTRRPDVNVLRAHNLMFTVENLLIGTSSFWGCGWGKVRWDDG
ncbi:hypothetical protein Ancab_008810 [Ancistrocladus abbreviatus]